tara:strand:- start:217 stop:828 length:612 start_codon:yes stop_codon:yes gene_type:complete
MTYNKPDTKLDECIFVAEKIIPADFCDYIVADIEKRPWSPHMWYNSQTDKNSSYETQELDVQITTPQLQKSLSPFIVEAGRKYFLNYAYTRESHIHDGGRNTMQMMSMFSAVRFNRYSPGQIMRQHHDHIHSLFDGKVKGVPVLTFILNLNDDYEGADLYFWEDTVVKLGKGDIVIFPSNWLYPHGVTSATKGKRYSASVWAW